MHMPQGLMNAGVGASTGGTGSGRMPMPGQRMTGGTGTGTSGGPASSRTLGILNQLMSLTPAELDRVEDRMRSEALARAGQRGGPAGMPMAPGGMQGMAAMGPTGAEAGSMQRPGGMTSSAPRH
jgi:hypothetical protein